MDKKPPLTLRKARFLLLVAVILIPALSAELLVAAGSSNPVGLSAPVLLQTHLPGNVGYCVYQLADGSLVLNTVNQSCTFLVKLDSSYRILWSRTIQIDGTAILPRLLVLSDGGYLLAGIVNNLYTLVKTDAQGNTQWVKTFSSGAPINYFMSVIQTRDGGFAIAGFGESVMEGLGSIWFTKTDSAANVQWNKTISGPVADCPSTIIQTADGGYILSDVSYSFVPNQAFFTLVRIDPNGNLLGNMTYGGYGYYYQPECNCALATSDGGFLMAGYLWQKPAWVVKTDAEGNMQWNQTYGEEGSSITDALETQSGYLLVEFSAPNDTGIVLTDKLGNQVWTGTFPSVTLPVGLEANFNTVIDAKDGGYIMVASKNDSAWLTKLNYEQDGSNWFQQNELQIFLVVDVAMAVTVVGLALLLMKIRRVFRTKT